jgi:predicted NUDIX family NTP pyrophosphohydrolase
MSQRSAGILLYRYDSDNLSVLLVHPGGPFWENKDTGAWSIPKGLYATDEDPLSAAKREFQEETGFAVEGDFLDLGELKQPSGKIVHAWALAGDLDVSKLISNTFELEWPRHSGRKQVFPEVDKGAWFGLETAKQKISPGQAPFLDRLRVKLRN